MLEVAAGGEVAVGECELADRGTDRMSSRWRGSLVAFLVESWPIGNAGVEKADVDIVEVICWIDPLAAGVVRLEVKVRRLRHSLGW